MIKKYRNLPLNPLRTFAVASRHKTFTSAGREMDVSQVAVSRQIATLESYLRVKLFERGTRSAKLTDVGRAFSYEIAGLFDEIERAVDRIRTNETNKTIHLRVYPTVAHYWLMPRLPDFIAQHPEYRIRLDTSVQPLDFRGTHLDVAIQLGRGDWKDTRSRKLMDETVDAICSPSYLSSARDLRTLADIRPSELLHARYRRQEWAVWSSAAGVEVNHREGLEFESSLLTYSACAAGMGLAIGQLEILHPDIESGRLVRPFNLPIRTESAFYVVWPTLTSVSVHARHFIDWLLAQVEQKPEFFRHRKQV